MAQQDRKKGNAAAAAAAGALIGAAAAAAAITLADKEKRKVVGKKVGELRKLGERKLDEFKKQSKQLEATATKTADAVGEDLQQAKEDLQETMDQSTTRSRTSRTRTSN